MRSSAFLVPAALRTSTMPFRAQSQESPSRFLRKISDRDRRSRTVLPRPKEIRSPEESLENVRHRQARAQ